MEQLKEQLASYIRASTGTDKLSFDSFLENLSLTPIKKKEHFITEGKICRHLGFFQNGFFRFYYLNDDGTETTLNFHFAPGFITSYTSFISGTPSRLSVQALEDMELMVIDKSQVDYLYNEHPEWLMLGKAMADIIAVDAEDHLFNLLNCTAEERYRMLLKKHPEYIHHIPLHYIASYLNVSPETISRIRKSVQ